jgi:DNA-binding XRE family transcriptional regulator
LWQGYFYCFKGLYHCLVRRGVQTDTHAVANYKQPKFFKISFRIPKEPPIQVTSLGSYLRKLRLERGLYQKDVAKVLGVANDSITYWENDRCVPKKDNLIKLMKFFEIDEESFFEFVHYVGNYPGSA